MNIRDEVVLVTGSNRGLGKALVVEALARGAKKVYAAARAVDRLTEVVDGSEGRVRPLRVDLADARSIADAREVATDVSVLVNNAGVLASLNVLTASRTQLDADLAVNFHGTLDVTRAFLPALERAKKAAIVNVLSVVSLASMPGIGGYSASKAASYSATQALRAELGKKGISVHAALPGLIDTDMVRDFPSPKTSPAEVARAILAGVEEGEEEILPDPMSRQLFELWKSDPKALERQLASM